jgi:hypothetical protein
MYGGLKNNEQIIEKEMYGGLKIYEQIIEK